MSAPRFCAWAHVARAVGMRADLSTPRGRRSRPWAAPDAYGLLRLVNSSWIDLDRLHSHVAAWAPAGQRGPSGTKRIKLLRRACASAPGSRIGSVPSSSSANLEWNLKITRSAMAARGYPDNRQEGGRRVR